TSTRSTVARSRWRTRGRTRTAASSSSSPRTRARGSTASTRSSAASRRASRLRTRSPTCPATRTTSRATTRSSSASCFTKKHSSPPAMEEEVGDHEHGAGDRDGEAEQARDREHVGDAEHALLVVLPPAQAVARARRDQQHRRERGSDKRRIEDVPVEPAELREAVRERHLEQE